MKPNRAGRAAVIYVTFAGIQRSVAFILLPFISHALTPGEYGAAATLVATSLLLTTLLAAPLEQLVFRFAARGEVEQHGELTAIFRYVFMVLPAVGLVTAGVVWTFQWDILGIDHRAWAVEFIAASVTPAATYFALPVVRAQHLLRRFIAISGTTIVAAAVSKIAFIVVGDMGLMGWALSDLITNMLALVVALAVVERPRHAITSRDVRSALRFAIPLIPHRASFWALTFIARPAMAATMTLTALGVFSFAQNLTSVAAIVLAEINRAVLPNYSREKFPAPGPHTQRIASVQVALALVVPAGVGASIALLGPYVFDSAYDASIGVCAVLILGHVAYGLYAIPMNYVVQTAGKPGLSWIASVVGAAVVLSSILLLGRNYGVYAVAWGNVAGYVVMAVLAFVLVRYLRLDVDWRAIFTHPTGLAIGVVALALAFAALTAEPQSLMAVGLAAGSISLCFASGYPLVRELLSARDAR